MLEVRTEEILDSPLQISSDEISFEDYLVKYDGQHAEWVDGKVIAKMPASDRHQDLVRFFTMTIGAFVEVRDLGIIRTSPLPMKLSQDRKGREPDFLFDLCRWRSGLSD
jgi:Uma2 family endonuclease